MRAKVTMRKIAGKTTPGLVPADDAARAALGKIKDGDLVLIEVWRPRSIAHHRLYFGLLDFVADATGRTVERLRSQIMVALGRCETLRQEDGTIVKVPDSIAFASMPQDEFNKLFDDTVEFLSSAFQMGPQELLDEFFAARPELRGGTTADALAKNAQEKVA